MASEREIEPASHAIAVNGGDRRSGEVSHGVHQALTHLRKAKSFRAGKRGDLVEIGSRGEKMHVAG